MARSSYIYVISDKIGPIAGFTVKHEMITWLRVLPEKKELKLHRISDSDTSKYPVELDIQRLLDM